MKPLQYQKAVSIQAPTESVYAAFTNPVHIRLWYGATAQLALRTHGHFTYADPSGDVYESGEFLEVKAGEVLRYKMEHHGFYKGSEVTVRFLSEGAATRLEPTHSGLSESDLQHASASWDWALLNLKTYMESGTVQTFQAWFESHKRNYRL